MLRERTHDSLQSCIHLMFHERFRNREVIHLDQFRDNLFALQIFLSVIPIVLQAFLDLRLQFVQRSRVAHVLRKFVIQFRQFLRLDANHIRRIVVFLSRQFRVRIVRRIFDGKFLVVANVRPTEVFVERLHRLFRSDVAHHIVRLQRFAATLRRSDQFQLHEVVVFHGPAFDRRKRRRPFAGFFQGLRDVFIRNFHRRHFNFKILVIAQLEFRQHFKHRAELHGLTLVVVELVHLRLRHRRQLLFRHRFFHGLWHKRLQYFAFDFFRKTLLDQGNRSFSWAETRHARHAHQFLRYFIRRLRHFLRGNFQFQFAAACCFCHAAILFSFSLCSFFWRLIRIRANEARPASVFPSTRYSSISYAENSVNSAPRSIMNSHSKITVRLP